MRWRSGALEGYQLQPPMLHSQIRAWSQGPDTVITFVSLVLGGACGLLEVLYVRTERG